MDIACWLYKDPGVGRVLEFDRYEEFKDVSAEFMLGYSVKNMAVVAGAGLVSEFKDTCRVLEFIKPYTIKYCGQGVKLETHDGGKPEYAAVSCTHGRIMACSTDTVPVELKSVLPESAGEHCCWVREDKRGSEITPRLGDICNIFEGCDSIVSGIEGLAEGNNEFAVYGMCGCMHVKAEPVSCGGGSKYRFTVLKLTKEQEAEIWDAVDADDRLNKLKGESEWEPFGEYDAVKDADDIIRELTKKYIFG